MQAVRQRHAEAWGGDLTSKGTFTYPATVQQGGSYISNIRGPIVWQGCVALVSDGRDQIVKLSQLQAKVVVGSVDDLCSTGGPAENEREKGCFYCSIKFDLVWSQPKSKQSGRSEAWKKHIKEPKRHIGEKSLATTTIMVCARGSQ